MTNTNEASGSLLYTRMRMLVAGAHPPVACQVSGVCGDSFPGEYVENSLLPWHLFFAVIRLFS